MTTDHETSRTLVKSPPELWAECSDAESLARHLGEFGEIRITRLEPETIVAWEGERASGTVRIEPSGWGTKVTLTAHTELEEEPAEPEALVEAPVVVAEEPVPGPVAPEPPVEREPDPPVESEPPELVAGTPPVTSGGLWSRLRLRFRPVTGPVQVALPVAEPAPQPDAPRAELEPQPEPEPPRAEPEPEAREPEPAAPEPQPREPEPEPAPVSADPDPAIVLTAALDSLGQAHHRPFSRA